MPVIKEIENTIKHSNVESHQPQATAHHLEVAVTKEITKTQEHISSKAKPLTPDLSIPLKHSLNQAVDTKVIVHRVPSSELSTPVNESPLTPLNKQKQQALKHLEEGHVVNQATSQTNNTPGNIILANIKTNEPLNQQLHTLVNQIVERIQILVPNLANQGRVQLVVDQGQLKGTEVSISLKNNQLTVTLVHSNQNAELLQQLRPELLERLQKINTEHQVRIITSHHEQPAHGGQQEQGQQQESSQKSRVINEWLEEQSDA
ncbi:hypothetical protein [Shewanella woodyi]|uniref:hypothetical protein n=1 Tax=Shewanella woodyi TaxID=60961 RepID=UPI003749B563